MNFYDKLEKCALRLKRRMLVHINVGLVAINRREDDFKKAKRTSTMGWSRYLG